MAESNEALLREVLAAMAVQGQRIEDIVARLDTASKDAREARDLGTNIATILKEQDIVARLSEHRGETRQSIAELRTDVVAANTLLKKELHAESEARAAGIASLDARLEALEADRNKAVGVANFFSWLARVAPWLLAGIAAFAAGAGFNGKLP